VKLLFENDEVIVISVLDCEEWLGALAFLVALKFIVPAAI
jgi:hypothetical protein